LCVYPLVYVPVCVILYRIRIPFLTDFAGNVNHKFDDGVRFIRPGYFDLCWPLILSHQNGSVRFEL